ncbi:hypothetical protein, partial [Shewanella hafniensis]|uniref:hypothetical protein n=1 Tax=Shewanella hafniensis TaxID=365590 RepID=UPI00200C820C
AAVLALLVYCLWGPKVVSLYFAGRIWLRPETKYQSGVLVYEWEREGSFPEETFLKASCKL